MTKFKNKTAIVICVNFKEKNFDEFIQESIALVESANYEILELMHMNKDKPDTSYFIGTGKVEELQALVNNLNPDSIILTNNLTPVQERNLDNLFESKIRVLDRTMLILEIFADRVQSREGQLQVELAMESHMMSRLVGRWDHFGHAGLGGEGEKQIELDKRLIKDKIHLLKQRIDKVSAQRDTQRKSRLNSILDSVAIVGYTNSGKSTLFNHIANANVYAENRLFATLSTTTRKCMIDKQHEIFLSDTVGFVRDLPHKLVAAFRATLEETVYADLLLHVVDYSNPTMKRQESDVNLVLAEIEASAIPQMIVYNKIDLVDGEHPRIEYSSTNKQEPVAVYLSALHKDGLDLLRLAVVEKLLVINRKPIVEKLVYEPWLDK